MDEAALDLLVVVPEGADPAPWIRAHAASAGAMGAVILAQAHSRGADRGDPAIITVDSPDGASIFHLWHAAIRRASAAYVAVVDARCPPAAGWSAGAVRAMREGLPAFFGPVTQPGSTGRARIEYALEYGQFARPVAAGLAEVPGNNLVFRRALLRPEDLRDGQFMKVFFIERLRREGVAIAYRDDLEVGYAKRYEALHYLRRRFAHGRSYAALRSTLHGLGWRLVRAATSPILPVLRLWRTARALRGKPGLRSALVSHFGYALAAESAWSLGECAGYLTRRPGDSAFLD